MKKMYYFYYFEKDNSNETFVKELLKYSLESFKEKDYIKHFIINLNIKKITGDDDLGRDLDLILSEMPKSYKVIKGILNDFKDFKIFYKLNFEISKVSKNINEMKNNFENGGLSFNSYFEKINSQMEDLFYIIHRNCLLVDPFLLKNIVINFFEVMLNYSSIDPNINNINYFMKSMNNNGKKRFKVYFSKFDFMIMYHYLDYKDICELKDKFDWSNTEINKNSKVDIINFFIDEIKFLFQKEKRNKIKTILVILTLLDISSSEIVEVINRLKLKGESDDFYKFVNRFILHYIKQIKVSKKLEDIVESLLIELLDKDPFSSHKIAMLDNLFYIFRSEEKIIKKWIEIILIGNYSKKHKEDVISFCSRHKNLKKIIEENKIGDILYNGSLQLKHDLIINNVLENNKKILLDILNSEDVEYLESLYVNNKILPEIIKKYNLKEKSVLIKLLENPELFSIEKVEKSNNNYIFMGNSMVHENIKKNEEFKKYAIDLIKKKINSNVNNNIKKSLTNILCDNYL